MTISALFILPLVAIALAYKRFWILDDTSRRSRKSRRLAHASVLIHRFLIVALMLAFVISFVWPIPSLPAFLQGTLITVVLMAPVCLYFFAKELAARVGKFLSIKRVGSAISLSKITGNKPAEPVLAAATANNNRASDFSVLAEHTSTASQTSPDLSLIHI